MTEPADDRTALARAFAWSSEVTSIALEMVLPGLLGLWLDRQLGTVLIFMVTGGALGMTLGLMHLVRLTKAIRSGEPPGSHRRPPRDQGPEEDSR